MSDELERIDTAPIQTLAGLRRERGVLEERLAKMEEMRAKVSAEVFERVQTDYETRREELDTQARPLEAAARREWVKLRQLHGECEAALRAAELEREEVDFRFALGELDEKTHQDRVAETDRIVGSRRERLEAVGEVRQAFLAVFDSEADLETGDDLPEAEDEVADEGEPVEAEEPGVDEAAEPDAAPEAEAPAEDAAPSPSEETGTMVTPTPTVEEELGPAADEDEFDDDEPTDVHAIPPIVAPAAPAGEVPPPPPFAGVVTTIGPESDDAGEMTVIIRRARLIRLDANGDAESELMLGSERVSIGRGSENTVRLEADAVSRQHAVVASRLGSYILYDLHSENGTFVNDEAVSERPLADGDRIRIGTVELVFRAK
jgi:hypothetical protein